MNLLTHNLNYIIMTDKTKQYYMYILGGLIFLGTFLLVGVLMFKPIPKGNSEVLYMAIGQLISGTLAVVYYFYGSSKSSSDKTELLKKGKSD